MHMGTTTTLAYGDPGSMAAAVRQDFITFACAYWPDVNRDNSASWTTWGQTWPMFQQLFTYTDPQTGLPTTDTHNYLAVWAQDHHSLSDPTYSLYAASQFSGFSGFAWGDWWPQKSAGQDIMTWSDGIKNHYGTLLDVFAANAFPSISTLAGHDFNILDAGGPDAIILGKCYYVVSGFNAVPYMWGALITGNILSIPRVTGFAPAQQGLTGGAAVVATDTAGIAAALNALAFRNYNINLNNGQTIFSVDGAITS
jgi:hypothetical protein